MKRKTAEAERPLSEVWDQWTEEQREQFIQEQIAASDRGEYTEPEPSERKRMDRVMARLKRGVGRPRIGKGAARINVTLEKGFLKEADAFRKRHGMSRSELISAGIRRVMADSGTPKRKAG